MPTGNLKNLAYRALLPLRAPSPRGVMRHACTGSLTDPSAYEWLLRRHHVLGSSLLLRDEARTAVVHTSLTGPHARVADDHTLYRVASITKIVTALAVLRLADAGKLSLEEAPADFIPEIAEETDGITLRMLLSHTSGLRDNPAHEQALVNGVSLKDALRMPGVNLGSEGRHFSYCNLGFGILGSVLEAATGLPVSQAVDELVLRPLEMRGTLDASTLDEDRIMPITRVLSSRPVRTLRVTVLGRRPLNEPDPLHHWGHTAGALYTDAESLSRVLSIISGDGIWGGKPFLSPARIADMTKTHAEYGRISPTLSYGLGLLIIQDPRLSSGQILGHQGFAYGCVDGAFYEESTGRQMIFLNGGCSEARTGRLGLCNRDLLRWAFREELPRWK